MPRKLSKEVPENFAVCMLAECSLADKCLRHISFKAALENKETIRVINPKKCGKNEECKFFKDYKPVIFARGFTNIQKKLYPDQYAKFMVLLTSSFGRNPYFERRRGESAMPPKEQEIVLKALRDVGFTGEAEFDSYEESPDWYQ